MTNDRDNSSHESKGFAGIISMVSNLEEIKQETRDDSNVKRSVNTDGNEKSDPQVLSDEERRPIARIPRMHRPSKTPWFLWVIGIVCIVWLISNIAQYNSSPSTQSENRSATKPSSTESSSGFTSRPVESRPPISESNLHSIEELQYCLAEEIRLNGADSSVNSYIESDINRYNAMVDDYNSRCASYRYYRTDFERARKAVERFRVQYYNEGKTRF